MPKSEVYMTPANIHKWLDSKPRNAIPSDFPDWLDTYLTQDVQNKVLSMDQAKTIRKYLMANTPRYPLTVIAEGDAQDAQAIADVRAIAENIMKCLKEEKVQE